LKFLPFDLEIPDYGAGGENKTGLEIERTKKGGKIEDLRENSGGEGKIETGF